MLTLAFVGTFLSAAVVAAGMHWLLGWGWQAALLFGSLIGATDPVSVIAMMKGQNAEPRLRFIMESESLLNDGAAAVLFSLCLVMIGGGSTGFSEIGASLILTVLGGVACGLVVSGGLLLVAGRSDDHLVELTLTVLPHTARSRWQSTSMCRAYWPRLPPACSWATGGKATFLPIGAGRR